MPAGPIGACWAAGSWPDTAWEANTWSGAGTGGYAFTGDLTTVFSAYVDALHDTALIASDSNTLVDADEANMIAGSTSTLNDRNSRYNEYLH